MCHMNGQAKRRDTSHRRVLRFGLGWETCEWNLLLSNFQQINTPFQTWRTTDSRGTAFG